MENKINISNNIQFNNARSVIDKLMRNKKSFCEDFLTMIPADLYDSVDISYEDLVNNAKPTVDL